MSAIELRQIAKRYGKLEVVHGIDLDISAGEFVVLLGPSGCGKTTTLRMVAGLEDVSDGTLSIGGKVVNAVAPKDRGVAMVFQNYALYPHMTVRQNMEFALRPLKLPREEVEKRVTETAATLGLDALLARKPAALSGGQRQRVAMARAMVRTPDVFLFDEPLSNLDAKLRTQVRWEIAKLHKRLGSTILYVTHDQVEAMTLADKIVIMRDGYVEQIGSPEEVYSNPRNTFVATFIGSPAMNLIPVRVVGDMLQSEGFQLPVPARFQGIAAEGQELLLGIRPREVQLLEQDAEGAIAAQVEVTEFLGDDALIDIRMGAHEMIIQVPAAQRPADDARISVRFNTAAIHLFDKDSGLSLIT